MGRRCDEASLGKVALLQKGIHDAENAFTATVEKLKNQSDYASHLDGFEYLESLSTESSDNDYSDIDDWE